MLKFIKWIVANTYFVEGKSASTININGNIFFLIYINESNSIKPCSYIFSIWDIEGEHTHNKYLSSAWVTYCSFKNKTKTHWSSRKLTDFLKRKNIFYNLFEAMKDIEA